MNLNIIDCLLITYSAFVRCWTKNGSKIGLYISYLYTSREAMKDYATLSLNLVYQ
jgi:hypothetical protein